MKKAGTTPAFFVKNNAHPLFFRRLRSFWVATGGRLTIVCPDYMSRSKTV